MKRKSIFSLTAIIVSFTIAFVLGEIILRIVGLGFGNAPLESDKIFHHVHPANYRFVVQTPNGEYGGHTIYYNEKRLISDPGTEGKFKEDAACTIAFLGDSFTEAAQVEYKKSFVGILSENTTCEVLNFGTSSYSPIFYELQWKRLIQELKPTLVVVQLFSNDISSDSEYFEMAKLNKNGEVISIPGPGGGWLISQLRQLYVIRFIRKIQLQLKWILENQDKEKNIIEGIVDENPEISPLSSRFMIKLAEYVKASGAEFVFFVIPSKYRIVNTISRRVNLEFSDRWKQWAKKNDISFIDTVQPIKDAARNGYRLFYDTDIHFNENGNAIIAREIAKEYSDLFESVDVYLNK